MPDRNNKQLVEEIVGKLHKEEVIGIGTETVYALAGNACSSAVFQKICALKRRQLTKPMAILLAHSGLITEFCSELPEYLKPILQRWMPGPLTLLLPAKPSRLSPLLSCHPYIGLRVPESELLLQVLNSVDFPLVASSANLSGQVAAINAAQLRSYFSEQELPNLYDLGEASLRLPSTVIAIDKQCCTIHRVGPISCEQLQQALPPDITIRNLAADAKLAMAENL